MGQVASILFFLIALAGAATIMATTLDEHWAEMIAALRGEAATRAPARTWVRSVRTQARPRLAQPRAAQPRHVAA